MTHKGWECCWSGWKESCKVHHHLGSQGLKMLLGWPGRDGAVHHLHRGGRGRAAQGGRQQRPGRARISPRGAGDQLSAARGRPVLPRQPGGGPLLHRCRMHRIQPLLISLLTQPSASYKGITEIPIEMRKSLKRSGEMASIEKGTLLLA